MTNIILREGALYMKNVFRVLMGLVMVIFLATPVVMAAENPMSAITVTGQAEMSVVPDTAVITAGVVTAGSDLESVRQENDRTVLQILDAVTTLGVERSKITTSQFLLQPIYRQQDPKEQATPVIIGYRVQNNMTIVVGDLAKTGAVIDAAFQAGANQFQGLRFGLKDDKAIRDELLKMAVLDGKRKAGIVAETLGVSVGKLISAVETGRINAVYTTDAATLKQSNAGTPVEPGSVKVGASVTLSFGL